MMIRIEEQYHPSHIAVVFDAGGKSARTELYAEYKSHRPPCPDDLLPQFARAKQLMQAMGYQVLNGVTGEADDVIATLARQAEHRGMNVVIVSSDKDLMQLCGQNIVLLDTMKNNGVGMTYGPKEVEEKFGVPPSQLGEVLALMGDSSDNIPGVPGIGPKTASQLIQTYGSIDNVLAHLEEIHIRGAEKIKASLRDHSAQLSLSRKLVTLHTEMDLGIEVEELIKKAYHADEFKKILQELEFKKFLHKYFKADASSISDTSADANARGTYALPLDLLSPPKREQQPLPESSFPAETTGQGGKEVLLIKPAQVILTKEELALWAKEVLSFRTVSLGISLPLMGSSRELSARTADVCGIALFAEANDAKTFADLPDSDLPNPIYLPMGHLYLGSPSQWTKEDLVSCLGPLFRSADIRKSVYGTKDTYLILEKLGFQLEGVATDPALCSYILDAARKHDLSSLCETYLQNDGVVPKSRDELCRQQKRAIAIESIEIEEVAKVAGYEAQAILKLGFFLRSLLPLDGQKLLDEIELPLGRVLAKIEKHGISLDTSVLSTLSTKLGEQLASIEEEVTQEAGYAVNINSPKQLQELLFEKLGLPGTKKTKTGFSTDAEVLESLAAENPIARKIHTHRTLSKLKNTYLDQLPQLLDPKTGRLHTSYHQVVAATGRLSSTEPNLQNIPIRTDLGLEIRKAFVAPEGSVLISADYSQIELRVLAHLSQDPLLLQSFLAKEDVHERTAKEMFGPVEGARPEMRRVAKMINYGIIYGLTDFGLATRLSIPKGVAKQYINEYFSRYQRVATFMDALVTKARREGGARTIFGRYRPLPELLSSNYQIRAYAERMAKNTPLQGTAADILKIAMIQVQEALENHPELAAKMLLTVHDELVFEVPQATSERTMELVRGLMEKACTLSVPLEVHVASGANWAKCK